MNIVHLQRADSKDLSWKYRSPIVKGDRPIDRLSDAAIAKTQIAYQREKERAKLIKSLKPKMTLQDHFNGLMQDLLELYPIAKCDPEKIKLTKQFAKRTNPLVNDVTRIDSGYYVISHNGITWTVIQYPGKGWVATSDTHRIAPLKTLAMVKEHIYSRDHIKPGVTPKTKEPVPFVDYGKRI